FTRSEWYIQIGYLVSCIAIGKAALLIAIPDSAQPVGSFFDELDRKRAALWLLLGGFIVYSLVEYLAPQYWGLAERWPPLGTVLSLPLQALLFNDALAIRLVSLGFYLATAYVVYKTVVLELNQSSALIGAILLLICPVFFVYGHYGFREMGGVFFISLGVYLAIRFIRSGKLDIYGMCLAIATLGYLQRRVAIVLALILGFLLLINFFRQTVKWRNLWAISLPGVAMIWIIFPWWIISLNIRAYKPELGNLLSLHYLTAYLVELPKLAGWPLCLLGLFGAVVGLIQRQRLLTVACLWIALVSILFAMDITAPAVINRFSIHFIPPLALIAAIGINLILQRSGRFYLLTSAILVLLCCIPLLVWQSDIKSLRPVLPGNRMNATAEPRFPFDQVAEWWSRQEGKPVLYQPKAWQSALPVYMRIQDIPRRRLVKASWKNLRDKTTIESALFDGSNKQGEYLIVPVKRDGKLLFHENETESTLRTRPGIGPIEQFANDFGKILLVRILD
ncbi:MAG: ArnT family glycosyltransferase, partial [bacterium]